MGPAFVLLFWTILYVVVSVIFGIIFAVVAWLVMRKRDGCSKWLVVFVSAITPLLFSMVELVLVYSFRADTVVVLTTTIRSV